jgi:hypothetical protein
VSESDDGPGRREVAHRLFAAEFDDVAVSYRESDEERAPNYVVLPTGARVNRAFAVGVLTEVEPVNEEVVRARVADPTGAFVSYAGQYQPEALAFFERTTPPTVVSLTGKARTFEPEDGDRVFSSLRPESVNEVDPDTRDRWIVDAARATLRRVAVTADALSREARGDDLRAELAAEGVAESLAAGVPLAIERYGVTGTYLEDVRRVAVEALEVVAGDRDAVSALSTRPDEGGPADLGPVPASVAFAPSGDETAAPSESAAETTGVEADAETVAAASDAVESASEASPAAEASSGPSDDPEPAGASSDPGPGVADEVGSDASPEPTAAGEPESASDPEPTGASESVADESASGPSTDGSEPGPEPEPQGGSEPSGDDIGDFDAGEFDDDLYEMDDDERAEAEEFGTEFATGSEVDPAGEAGIDVPEEPPEPEPEPDTGAADEADDDEAEIDLEDAAVAAMETLDDGSGANREAVVAHVVEAHGADPDAVEDAVQDALMSGRCYEPDEATLKPI